MVGAPRDILLGSLADLRKPDAVIIDEAGYKYLWPDAPYELGRTFEMNDRRAVIVGICKASDTFQTFPILSGDSRVMPSSRRASELNDMQLGRTGPQA